MLARGQKSGLLVLGDALWVLAAVPLAALARLGPESELARQPLFLLAVGASILNPRIVGTWPDLVPICTRERIDRVLVCVSDRRGNLPTAELLDARTRGIEVEDGATFSERLTGRVPLRDITPSWFIFG